MSTTASGHRLWSPGANRDAYVMCLLTQLHAALGRRDIFAEPSLRWTDPRARLLDGPDWAVVREDVLAGLGLTAPVQAHLAECATALDAAWRQLAQRIEEAGPDASVRVVPGEAGWMRLSVQRLEKLGDPPSLVDLRKRVAAMLPIVDLGALSSAPRHSPSYQTNFRAPYRRTAERFNRAVQQDLSPDGSSCSHDEHADDSLPPCTDRNRGHRRVFTLHVVSGQPAAA